MEQQTTREPRSAIRRYISSVWLEKGLSEATCEAYQRDLTQFEEWSDCDLLSSRESNILDFLAYKQEQGCSARSSARFLSTFRGFYKYSIERGDIEYNPCSKIQNPKLGRPIPDVLSEQDVESLLHAPDTEKNAGRVSRSRYVRSTVCNRIARKRGGFAHDAFRKYATECDSRYGQGVPRNASCRSASTRLCGSKAIFATHVPNWCKAIDAVHCSPAIGGNRCAVRPFGTPSNAMPNELESPNLSRRTRFATPSPRTC